MAAVLGCGSSGNVVGSVSAPASVVKVSGNTSVSIGSSSQYSASIVGAASQSVRWEVLGTGSAAGTVYGSITTEGVYTPPAVMPADNVVTIEASSATPGASPGSLSVTILQPTPSVVSATASSADGGSTILLDVVGLHVAGGASLLVQGAQAPTTAISPSELQATLSGSNLSGPLTVSIENPAPGAEISSGVPVTLTLYKATARAAARMLEQSTFGPSSATVAQVQSEGITAFLADQFRQPPTLLPVLGPVHVASDLPAYCLGYETNCVDYNWLSAILTGDDQLRERVAFALSEIFVVSENTEQGVAFPYFLNTLATDAFANWSTIMHDVYLSPAMGAYLNMLNSAKPAAGEIADENFARESMQLFSIGVNQLNMDGTVVLDSNGTPLPNYSEAQVQAFARAYTGWTFANADGSTPSAFLPLWTPNWNAPMVPVEALHDTTAKILLGGMTLPAGQSAVQDLEGSIDSVFQNASLPPFICKQLIQHLVTSNPSPAYVSRISQAFVNNDSGVRGDMKAVIAAILLDPEARKGDADASDASFGHLREPVLWLANVFRGVGFTPLVATPAAYNDVDWFTSILSEPLHSAPSVFNFFPPDNSLPNSSTLAPEFVLENTATVVEQENLADWIVRDSDLGNISVDLTSGSPLGIRATANPQALLDQLNLIFMHGAMSPAMNQAILDSISSLADPAARVRLAVYLIITSPEYKILS